MLDWFRKKTKHRFSKICIAGFAFGLFFAFPLLVRATMYLPGETLEPDCAPGSVDCGVLPIGDAHTGSGAPALVDPNTGALFLDTTGGIFYAYNGTAWVAVGSGTSITSLNGQTGPSQTFVVGSSGTDFNISSGSDVHTFNIPDASALNRGLVTTGTQTIAGAKTFSGAVVAASLSSNDFDRSTAGVLTFGNTNATSASVCNSAGCDTVLIGTNADADTVSLGDALDTVTFTGNSSSTIVFNGVTLDATELNRLDGHDAALVDTNDAVATAITGSGTLNAGSISSGFGSIDTGADSITTTGSVFGNDFDRSTAGALTFGNANATSVSVCNSAGCDTITIGASADADTITLGDTSDALSIASTGFNLTTGGVATGLSIAAGSNTISGLTNANLSSTAGITNANLANSAVTVTAGSGLINGGSVSLGGSTTLDIGAGSGIVANANDVAVNLTTSGTTGSTSSNSGLEVSSSGLALLKGCADTEILKWSDAGGWACAADASGGSPVLSAIAAASGSNSINNGDNAQVWNWALTTAAKTAFAFGENSASTNGLGGQYILSASTLASSTAAPFKVIARGNTIINTTPAGAITIGSAAAGQSISIDSGPATIEIGTSNEDKIINIGDTATVSIHLDTAPNAIEIGDNASVKTIELGGNDANGTDNIVIATEGTSPDTIEVGNTNAATTVAINGGTAWSVSTAGALNVASLTRGADTITDFSGNGVTVSSNALTINLPAATNALSATTSSGSGLEVLSAGLTLLQGCSDAQILKWNETTDTWACASDNSSGSTTLQDVYGTGNTITTTSGRDIGFVLAELASPTSFTVENQDTAGVSAQKISNSIASGALTNGLLIEQAGVGTMTNGIQIAESAGTITDGILITGTLENILNSPSLDITGAGAITGATGVTLTSGDVTTTGSILGNDFDRSTAGVLTFGNINATSASICNSTGCDTVTIGTNADADTITIGDTLDAFSIASTGLNVTSGGALTGVASIDTIATSATALTFAGAGTISSTTTSAIAFDSGTTGTVNLGTGNNAKTINLGTGTAGNVINIGTDNTVADAIGFGSALDTFTIVGNSSSTFVLNAVTLDVTELNRLDGHDVALVDANDAVSTAITGTGALNSGSITSGFGSIDTGADSVTTTGSVFGNDFDRSTAGALTFGNTNATSISLCNSVSCDTISIGTNADADAITIGDTLDSLAFASTGLNLTSGGALTGVASIDTIATSATALTFAGTGTISSTTSSAITVDSGTTGDVNVGTGASAKTVNVGNTTGATALNLQSGTGNITMTVDGTGSSGKVQIGNSGTATPDLLVLDNGTADPTGVNGGIYYNTTTNKFRCYQNSAWTNCIGGDKLFITKSANQSVTNSTTLVDDTELQFPIAAGESWVVHWHLMVTNNNSATPDWKSAVLGPASTTCDIVLSGEEPVGAAFPQAETTDCTTPGTLVNGTIVANASIDFIVDLQGFVTAGATPGTINMQFAENTAGGGTSITIQAGSYMTAFKVGGADLAEVYGSNDITIEPGDVVSVDPSLENGVQKSTQAYDASALGIVSTNPGQVIGDKDLSGAPVLVALSGRVPVKVVTENGAIAVGDYLTSSSTPGVAMKSNGTGPVIGQALVAYDDEGVGKIMVFVKNFNLGESATHLGDVSSAISLDGSSSGISTLVATIQSEIARNPIAIINAKIAAGQQFLTDFIAARVTAIRGYFDEVFARIVHTEQLCVKKTDGTEVCVNGDQLQSAINGAAVSSPSAVSSGSAPSAPVVDTNDIEPSPEVNSEVGPVAEVVSDTPDVTAVPVLDASAPVAADGAVIDSQVVAPETVTSDVVLDGSEVVLVPDVAVAPVQEVAAPEPVASAVVDTPPTVESSAPDPAPTP